MADFILQGSVKDTTGNTTTGAVTVTVNVTPQGCLTSTGVFQNSAFASQNGFFTATFDATPNGAGLDAVTGLSRSAAAAYTDMAVIVRFNTSNKIDARNGGTYAATNSISYVPGTVYHFRVVVDISSHTYSAFVTPAGGTEQTVGTGFAFRTEQATVASLANWTLTQITGTHTICNFAIVGSQPPPPPVVTTVSVPASVAVQVGQTAQLTATVKDQNGNTMTGQTVAWSSSNTALATVSSTGLVTTIAVGSVIITAAVGLVHGTTALTISTVVVSAVPAHGHVFVVVEENSDYTSIIGNSSMPYLNSLATKYGLATQYYAVTHPSIGNYFSLTCGQILTNDDGSSTIENVPNIVRSLVAAGKTWKAYSESLPSVGYLGGDTGEYARKHDTIALYSDVALDPNGQARNLVPFTQFATDLAAGTLPNYSFIDPNLIDDLHDGSPAQADAWLKTNIDPLIQSPLFQSDGLLFIVFDEAGGDSTNGGGRVACVVVSAKVKPGFQSAVLYQHPSLLRTCMEALGLTSFPGAAATAKDMADFFQSSGAGSIVLTGLRTTAFDNSSLPNGQVIDATNCQFVCDPSIQIPVRLAGGTGCRWHAGEVLGSTPPATSWSVMHDMYSILVKGTTNLIIENAFCFNYGDGISFDSLGNDGFIIRDSLIRYSRDDGLENDFYATGTYDNCFLDGVYDGASCQQYAGPPDGSAKFVTMQNCLVRLQPMDAAFSGPVPNHNGFWKWATDAPQLKLYNNVFRADSASQEGPSVNMSMFPWPGKQADATNNVLCWLADGAGPPGEAVPVGWVVLTGQAALDRWNTAVANWQTTHPLLQADRHAPICSMFQPGLVGPTTLTGSVTLIATAVDDRAVVGVQFNLSGTAIGVEATSPTTYAFPLKGIQNYDRFTKYNLSWDSRTVPNGTYTLTATARDTAGNKTTSAGVTVTVSN